MCIFPMSEQQILLAWAERFWWDKLEKCNSQSVSNNILQPVVPWVFHAEPKYRVLLYPAFIV